MNAQLDTSKVVWDLSPLLSGFDDPAAAEDFARVRAANEEFAVKWRDRDDYLVDMSTLREALDDYEELRSGNGISLEFSLCGKAGYYAWLREFQDNSDPEVQAMRQQAVNAVNEVQELIRFFEHSLGEIAPARQVRFLEDPELVEYKHFLERNFAKAHHRLPAVEEKIIDLKSATSHAKWVQASKKILLSQKRSVALSDETVQEQDFEQLLTLSSNKDKIIRDGAAVAFNDILDSARSVAEAEMNAILANHKVDDELRGYGRPEASQFLQSDIEPDVVDAMLEIVPSRNDIAHRFYRLKAGLLGLPELEYHEREVQYGKINQKYDWDNSCAIVNEVYSELDPEFGKVFRGFLANGQFDVYPRSGKTNGAWCMYFTKDMPSYVLLNHNGELRNVISLAHEFGHGLNNEFVRRAQNSLNFGTPTSTAEVASIYLEDFFYDHLLNGADDETRLAVSVSRLAKEVQSIHRQVGCVLFEQKLHTNFRANGYLSADEIGTLFQTEMAAYMGSAVKQSPGSENWWIHWPHIRRFFYSYSYASGRLIAKSMQKATRKDKAFLEKVKEFLSAGRSASPREIFARMDIDITDPAFWNDGLDEIEHLLDETEQLAISMGKLPVL